MNPSFNLFFSPVFKKKLIYTLIYIQMVRFEQTEVVTLME